MLPPNSHVPFSSSDIVRLRRQMADRYGGDRTERETDADCIDGAVGGAIMNAHYLAEGGQLDPLHVAACLLISIALRHCFTDGNKRVAWAATVDFLLTEGLEIVAEEDEAAQLVLDVVNHQIDRDQLIGWLSESGRLRAYRPPECSPPSS